jgi:hypothetical protein
MMTFENDKRFAEQFHLPENIGVLCFDAAILLLARSQSRVDRRSKPQIIF